MGSKRRGLAFHLFLLGDPFELLTAGRGVPVGCTVPGPGPGEMTFWGESFRHRHMRVEKTGEAKGNVITCHFLMTWFTGKPRDPSHWAVGYQPGQQGHRLARFHARCSEVAVSLGQMCRGLWSTRHDSRPFPQTPGNQEQLDISGTLFSSRSHVPRMFRCLISHGHWGKAH